MRISEALALRFADLTPDGLLIRKAKFHKTRLVPLHDTTVAALQHYLRRRQTYSSGDHVFIDQKGRPLSYGAVYGTFQKLLKKAGLWPSTTPHRPRLHTLRHAFAVRALQGSPTGRECIGQHTVALAPPISVTSTSTPPTGTPPCVSPLQLLLSQPLGFQQHKLFDLHVSHCVGNAPHRQTRLPQSGKRHPVDSKSTVIVDHHRRGSQP